MPAAQDLADRTFELLTVERLATEDEFHDTLGRRRWRCRCQCGAIVYHTTAELNSGRYGACPDCGGPQPHRTWPCVCVVCTRHYQGRGNVCSPECRKARRRAVDAGLPDAGGLPAPVRTCVECGESFPANRNFDTCSPACRLAKKRRKGRESYRRRAAKDPTLSKRAAQRRRERVRSDPEYAKLVRAWEARKQARHRERMATDPDYAARYRDRANAHYARHREAIQATRHDRLEAMNPVELEAWLDRARRYCRHWRRRLLAGIVGDPIQHQRYLDIQREYRHQRRRRKLALDAARIEAAFGEEQSDGDH